MAIWALLLLLAPPQESAAPPPTLTVAEVTRHLVALDGKAVRVRGWVSRSCYVFGCTLLSRLPRDGQPVPRDVSGVSIGYEAAFEPILRSVIGADVILEARVDATCRRENVICTDRAPDLRPYRLIRVIQRSPDQP